MTRLPVPGRVAPRLDLTVGPFESEAQARNVPAVRDAYAAARASDARGVLAEHGARMITEACEAAGVELGAYDKRIGWLAGFEGGAPYRGPDS